jgi:hypothetical protein
LRRGDRFAQQQTALSPRADLDASKGRQMVSLKHSEMRIFDDAFDMHGGYVLNFSDRSFSGFFDDEFGITIYCEKYNFNGSSKAKHMQAFIKTDDE